MPELWKSLERWGLGGTEASSGARDVGAGSEKTAVRGDEGKIQLDGRDHELGVIRGEAAFGRNVEDLIAGRLEFVRAEQNQRSMPGFVRLFAREHSCASGRCEHIQKLASPERGQHPWRFAFPYRPSEIGLVTFDEEVGDEVRIGDDQRRSRRARSRSACVSGRAPCTRIRSISASVGGPERSSSAVSRIVMTSAFKLRRFAAARLFRSR